MLIVVPAVCHREFAEQHHQLTWRNLLEHARTKLSARHHWLIPQSVCPGLHASLVERVVVDQCATPNRRSDRLVQCLRDVLPDAASTARVDVGSVQPRSDDWPLRFYNVEQAGDDFGSSRDQRLVRCTRVLLVQSEIAWSREAVIQVGHVVPRQVGTIKVYGSL